MWNQFVDMKLKGETYEEQKLLKTLYNEMFAVAYAKMGNRSDALDTVQESWLKILHKIDTLHQQDKIVPWAKAITNNTAKNMIREKIVWNEKRTNDWVLEKVGHIDEYEDWVLLRDIKESMNQLDQETQLMLICKYFYGWKDRQIAEHFCCPEGTVKARIHRAKERLRKMLKSSYEAYLPNE